MSFVHWGANYDAIPIGQNESIEWTFTNPSDDADNYVGPYACFFNFNNLQRSHLDLQNDTP